MEFNVKLQYLRKQNDFTQEQLAEQLYVSRTAISKWESGRGYPSIESLKSISNLFSVSIDDLLSSEELISLAEDENRSNIAKIISLIFGILDVMSLAFLVLPLYGQPEGEYIHSVNLFAFTNASTATRAIYFILPSLMIIIGISILVMQNLNNKLLNATKIVSIMVQAFTIFVFINTRQPYAASLVFIFFIVKILLLTKGNKIK